MPFMENRFPNPQVRNEIVDLVSSHQKLTNEPLLLAICYDPRRSDNHNDIFIFEVMDGFGDNMIDPDGDLFEVEFGSSTSVDLHLPAGSKIHLVMTNPIELSAALERRWGRACEVIDAISRNDFHVLYEDPRQGNELLKRLMPPEAAE